MKKALIWELIGIIFIVIVGSALHFLFELSGHWTPVGAIAAVNESVWEHLKLGAFPAVFFALIEYKFLKKETNNFWMAKAAAVYVIPVVIVVLFYSYTAVVGHSVLAIDITIFVIAVIVGQLASYKLLTSSALPKKWDIISGVVIVLLIAAMVVFTFYPPHLPIFRDPLTGGYGIV